MLTIWTLQNKTNLHLNINKLIFVVEMFLILFFCNQLLKESNVDM